MKAKDFSAWIAHMAWNDSEVARKLDISRNSVAKYKEEGAPAYIGLACAALAANLLEWEESPRRGITTDDLVWLAIRQLVAREEPLSFSGVRALLTTFPTNEVNASLAKLAGSREVRAETNRDAFTLTRAGLSKIGLGGEAD